MVVPAKPGTTIICCRRPSFVVGLYSLGLFFEPNGRPRFFGAADPSDIKFNFGRPGPRFFAAPLPGGLPGPRFTPLPGGRPRLRFTPLPGGRPGPRFTPSDAAA